VLDAEPEKAPVGDWYGRALKNGGLVDASWLKASLFRAGTGNRLRVRGGASGFRGRAAGHYFHAKREIWLNVDSSLKFDKEYAGTFRHEFGHYLDTNGHLPLPRSKRYSRPVYLSSRAAKELRDDHDKIMAAETKAAGAGETAEDLYRHLGVDLDEFDADFYEYHLGDKMLNLHGGDEAAALLAIKKQEKRIGEWLKSRGVDFPYEELLNHVGADDMHMRGQAAMRLAVEIARGDRTRGINHALGIGLDTAASAKNTFKLRKLARLRDYIGALTNERYSHLRGEGYYKKGTVRLFKTEVGTISDLNLAEGFANYMDLRYDAGGRMEYDLAKRMFPATTRRFGEILDEIGNGEHAYDSGRDYATENKLTATRKREK